MGQTYIIVDPAKRQYLEPGVWAGPDKLHCKLDDWIAPPVGILLSDCGEAERQLIGPLSGAWAGDPVILAGEYAPADKGGIITSTPDSPDANLYSIAHDQYEPLIYRVIAMLCRHPHWARRFGEQVAKSRDFQNRLAFLAIYIGSDAVERVLNEYAGDDWRADFAREGFREIHPSDYRAFTNPTDVASALHLYERNSSWLWEWVVGLLGTTRGDSIAVEKLGTLTKHPFQDPHTGRHFVLATVFRWQDLDAGFLSRMLAATEPAAAITVFVTLEAPDEEVVKLAEQAGEWSVTRGDKGYPRAQILTMADLLAGKRIRMPNPPASRERKRVEIADMPHTWPPNTAPAGVEESERAWPNGDDYVVVNLTKRQYLDAGAWPGGTAADGRLGGWTSVALGQLICIAGQHPNGDWAGDPIVLTTSDAAPNSLGLSTGTTENPNRNLYAMAREEFEDISYSVLRELCVADYAQLHDIVAAGWIDAQRRYLILTLLEPAAGQLARQADNQEAVLILLGDIVRSLGSVALRAALIRALGSGWEQRYQNARSSHPGCGLQTGDE